MTFHVKNLYGLSALTSLTAKRTKIIREQSTLFSLIVKCSLKSAEMNNVTDLEEEEEEEEGIEKERNQKGAFLSL